MAPYRLLGDVAAGPERAPLALGGTRQRATLAMLLMSPNRFVSDDRLIAGIAVDEPGSLGSLRTFVSGLRRVLGPVIERRGTGYALLVDEDDIDLMRFRALVTRAREAQDSLRLAVAADLLRDAVALWRGPALGGLERLTLHRDAAPALAEERAAATDLRFSVDLALGRHEHALPDLWEAAAAEPLRERRWAQLMLALYRSGQQAEALHAYSLLRRRMADELGLDPGPDLRRLESEMIAARPGLDWQPTPERRASPGGGDHPRRLPARRRDLERMRSFARAHGGRGSIVVRGAAGMGKSVLIRTFVETVQSEGALVLAAACTPHAPPFAAVREVLADVDHLAPASGAPLPELALILPGVRVPEAERAERSLPWSPDRILAAATRLLAHAADSSASTVLVLEDMQWADATTTAFVDAVLGSPARVLVVLSTRGSARPPSRRPQLDVALRALSPQETADLWRELGGRATALSDPGAVHAVTGGVPFYVAALAEAEGTDVGTVVGGDAARAHREILDRRLASLGEGTLDLMTAIAVTGSPVRVYELAATTGRVVTEVVEGLQPAVDAGVLVVQPQLRYGFAHDLIAGHVAAAASRPTVALLHCAAAAALVGDRTPRALLRRWRHMMHAEGMVSQAELLDAARSALAALERSGGVDEAERLCESTLAATGEASEAAAELLVRLAVLLGRAARPESARAALARAASAARAAEAHHLLIDVMRASDPFDPALSGDPRRAATVREALQLLGTSPTPTRLSGLVALSVAEHRNGHSSNARSLLDEAAACASALGTPAASGMVGHLRHLLDRSSTTGRRDAGERSRATAQAIGHAVRSGDLDLIIATSADALTDALEFGTLDEARAALHGLRTYAAQVEVPMPRWVAACAEVVLAQGAGDVERTELLESAAFEVGRQHGIGLADVALSAHRLVDGILTGDFSRILASFAAVTERNADAPAWAFAEALARARSGDVAGAGRVLSAAGGVARLPDDWLRPAGLMLAAEATALAGGPDEPASLIALLDPWLRGDVVVGTALVGLGPVRRVTGLLHAATGASEEAATHLVAAAERSNERGMRAWARLALGPAEEQARLAHRGDLADRASALSARLTASAPLTGKNPP